MNEKKPFRNVSLGKGSVTLLPRGKPYRLRNNSSVTVEFRVIEILSEVNLRQSNAVAKPYRQLLAYHRRW